METVSTTPVYKDLGLVDYQPTWDAMRELTEQRNQETRDELWFLQHPPVFTQGLNGKAEHILFPGDIPVIAIDRGGQITYHGPGQLVVYPLLDLARLRLNTRSLVCLLETAIIQTLADYDIEAYGKRDAPGVYVDERKIASLGLRIKKQRSYHGLALNIDMDLEPFARINPCGYQGLVMTDMQQEASQHIEFDQVSRSLKSHLIGALGESLTQATP
ncbi:MAG: lipoyl(octanoyl) transferase LipB [Gammaproteobacteria bacterium]|nr:lipoyl(octanoyl) transferase LipB [Gammaproteobacteria bacterium]